ncbi:ATP synthase complex subunit H-domain-containing protein [Aspergillus filifer]
MKAVLFSQILSSGPLIYTPATMMSQSLRASRSLFARVSRQQGPSVARRTFLTSAVRQADPVQELYLRELRAYKPTPIKPGDAEAHVQKFSIPAAPKSPEEASLANELSSYESQEVEVEGQSAAGEANPVEESWFEEEDETPAAH